MLIWAKKNIFCWMCEYKHIHTHVSTHIHTHVSTHVSIHVSIHVSLQAHTHTFTAHHSFSRWVFPVLALTFRASSANHLVLQMSPAVTGIGQNSSAVRGL